MNLEFKSMLLTFRCNKSMVSDVEILIEAVPFSRPDYKFIFV